jgi:hypothetical protein
MANLALTVLDAYRLPYADSALDLAEHRLSQYGVFELFKRDTPNLIPAATLEAGRKAQTRPVTIPVIKTKDYAITNTRSCAVVTNSNESAFVTLVFGTIVWNFHMVPSQYGNNYIGLQQDFNMKMKDSQKSILTAMDIACYNYLNANKSQVNNGAGKPYPFTNNVILFPATDTNNVLNELSSIMYQNDLNGRFNLVATPRMQSLVNLLKNQGIGNAQNLAFQFGDFDLGFSNRVTLSDNARDTFFVMPKGSAGIVTWIDPSARMGEQAYNTTWTVENLPELGFEVGLKTQVGCNDNSTEAGAGFEASNRIHYQFSFDYALVTPYNSSPATLPGTILKADILAQ